MCVSIEKKINHPEQKLASISTSVPGDFFLLLNTPVSNIHDGYINRKERKKSPLTEVEKGSQLLFGVIFPFFY